MTTTQADPAASGPADFNYWSLKIQVRDIKWSPLRKAWVAYLVDFKTRIKGAMEICIDCVAAHVYHYCDGTHTKQFEPCNMKRLVYHPSYVEWHRSLETNNEYVRQALSRTPRRKLIASGPLGVTTWCGYDPKTKVHRRHMEKCFRGPSPQYVIQGGEGLGNSIYYRRCDGKFRNLAHQVLKIGEDEDGVTPLKPLKIIQWVNGTDQGPRPMALVIRGLRNSPPKGASKSGRASEVNENRLHKRKRQKNRTEG